MEPFNVLSGPEAVAEEFWIPLLSAFGLLQRRDDVFMAGRHQNQKGPFSNHVRNIHELLNLNVHLSAYRVIPAIECGRHMSTVPKDGAIWVFTMGHLLGLFDRPWLDIPPTGSTGLS